MTTIDKLTIDQELKIRSKYPPKRMILIIVGTVLYAFLVLQILELFISSFTSIIETNSFDTAINEFVTFNYSSLGLLAGGGTVCFYLQLNMSELDFIIRKLQESPLVIVGIVILLLFAGLAIAAPYVTTFGAEDRIWGEQNMHPNFKHLFGTDLRGGDTFSRCFWALQVDLEIAFFVVIIAAIIGIFLGGIAGYYGGVIDEVIMRITDVFLAFPGLILAMAIAAVLGRSMINIAWALIAVWWTPYVRLIRAQVLTESI
ncbi:MAG: ABC transporter permease [Candidatus Hodarchaeales archaeon]